MKRIGKLGKPRLQQHNATCKLPERHLGQQAGRIDKFFLRPAIRPREEAGNQEQQFKAAHTYSNYKTTRPRRIEQGRTIYGI
jgi:hypothetical protein